MKTELLQIEERTCWELVPGEFTHQKLASDFTQMPEKTGKNQRCCTGKTQHVQGIGIVAEHQRPALSWAKPQTLLAERDGILAEPHACVHIEWIKTINCRN